MRERDVEAALRSGVRKLGGRSMKLVPLIAGTPDQLVLLPGGRTVFVEVKAEGGTLAPVQIVQHTRLRKLGFTVVVLTGKREVDTWVRAQSRPQ